MTSNFPPPPQLDAAAGTALAAAAAAGGCGLARVDAERNALAAHGAAALLAGPFPLATLRLAANQVLPPPPGPRDPVGHGRSGGWRGGGGWLVGGREGLLWC